MCLLIEETKTMKPSSAAMLATAIFVIAEEIEGQFPGTCAKLGWVKLRDLEDLAGSLDAASRAKLPTGWLSRPIEGQKKPSSE